MSRKSIWLTSFVLSLVVWFGFRQWKPYFFGQMLSGDMIRQMPLTGAITWEPATLISLLLIGFAFLLCSNILHTLFYRPNASPKQVSAKSSQTQSFKAGDIDADERIREQLLRRANSIDRKEHRQS